MSKLKNKQDSVQHKKDVEKDKAEEIAKKLKDITVNIKVKAGDNGRIFGGVTSKEISENLKQQFKKKIVLNETIKNLGVFNVQAKLFEGVTGNIKVNVQN